MKKNLNSLTLKKNKISNLNQAQTKGGTSKEMETIAVTVTDTVSYLLSCDSCS